jgi:hypothetical protein
MGAKIVLHTKDLPEYNGPLIPGLQPPIRLPLLYTDEDGDPAEADAFNEMIREIRGKAPASNK